MINVKKVFVANPISPEAMALLKEHVQCVTWEGEGKLGREQFLELIRDADGLINFGARIDGELLRHASKLKVVSNTSVGYNNFDLDAMRAAGVMGTHTPGVIDDTVADLIVALMLATARRVPQLDQLIRQGQWVKGMNTKLFGVDVHHATLGIIGMGRIGKAVAKRAHFGFDMDILYCNRSRNEQAERTYNATYCTQEELLARSDFVVVMTPLTKQTENMIGEAQFKQMKRSAIFINASRGHVVDEAAMIEALQTGEILGAGLDVFQVEPIEPDNPLLEMSNVVLLPHIGTATLKTRNDMAMLAVRNMIDGLSGRVPDNLVPELR